MMVYKLTVSKTIEFELTITDNYYYLTEEDMNNARDRYRLENIRDGKLIQNISSISFDEDRISFDDAKDEMTVQQLEEMFNMKVSVSDFGELVMNNIKMTKDRAIEILSEELHDAKYLQGLSDSNSPNYTEDQELVDALTIAIDCIKGTL